VTFVFGGWMFHELTSVGERGLTQPYPQYTRRGMT